MYSRLIYITSGLFLACVPVFYLHAQTAQEVSSLIDSIEAENDSAENKIYLYEGYGYDVEYIEVIEREVETALVLANTEYNEEDYQQAYEYAQDAESTLQNLVGELEVVYEDIGFRTTIILEQIQTDINDFEEILSQYAQSGEYLVSDIDSVQNTLTGISQEYIEVEDMHQTGEYTQALSEAQALLNQVESLAIEIDNLQPTEANEYQSSLDFYNNQLEELESIFVSLEGGSYPQVQDASPFLQTTSALQQEAQNMLTSASYDSEDIEQMLGEIASNLEQAETIITEVHSVVYSEAETSINEAETLVEQVHERYLEYTAVGSQAPYIETTISHAQGELAQAQNSWNEESYAQAQTHGLQAITYSNQASALVDDLSFDITTQANNLKLKVEEGVASQETIYSSLLSQGEDSASVDSLFTEINSLLDEGDRYLEQGDNYEAFSVLQEAYDELFTLREEVMALEESMSTNEVNHDETQSIINEEPQEEDFLITTEELVHTPQVEEGQAQSSVESLSEQQKAMLRVLIISIIAQIVSNPQEEVSVNISQLMKFL